MSMTSSETQVLESGENDIVVDLISSGAEDTVPIDLHVHKLNYTVTDKPGKWWQQITNIQMPWEWMEEGRTNHILKDVSFTAKSGNLLAIMGGSGSGKTTLLDVLAHRTVTGEISGDIFLNSVSYTKDIVDACCGYVRQDDRLISFLTVRETLMFVAQLKLPKTFTKKQIAERVESVILELGLKHAADTRVGGAHERGLSGGERRRVSIGIQLLILPSILLLDEPTSGLDSFTASNIAMTLSKLASKQRTIIMSIHQPRFNIFSIVDVMMILSKGKTVYYGPSKEMVPYFTTLGYPCPDLTNPCDYYIDLATVDPTSREREEMTWATVHALHEAYSATDTAKAQDTYSVSNVISVDEVETFSDHSPNKKWAYQPKDKTLKQLLKSHEQRRSTPGISTQFYYLTRRFIRVTIDDWQSLLTHMLEALFMSFLLGTAFYQLEFDQKSVRDWFGVSFMISVMYPYMVILGLIGKCHEERKFLYFELQDKLYHPISFYFAKVLSDVPFHLFQIMIYCLPVYILAGLKLDSYHCGMFYLFVSVSVFTSRCLAMMCAALLPTFHLSCVFAQTFFSPMIMSAGFLINIKNIIPETQWIADWSYLRWGYQALTYIQVEDLKFTCEPNPREPCLPDGSTAISAYGLDSGELWTCGVGLAANMVCFLVLMLVGLLYVPQKPHDEG